MIQPTVMKPILLLGGSGLLGNEFEDIFKKEDIPFLAPTRTELDLMKDNSIKEFFQKNNPKSFSKIVFCAAYTAVDKAEEEKELCKKLNTEAIKTILEYQIPIIHFSTDYVFDVSEEIEIPENYPRKALNFYGQTKVWAEEALETSRTDWWNIRTTWLFGKYGKNFVSTIKQKSQKNEPLKIVDDEIGRPTSAKDLAEFVTKNFIQNIQPTGHYHLQNQGESVSWAGLAEYIILKNDRNVPWSVSTQIKKISSISLNRPAKRPKNSVLKNTKLNKNLRNWTQSVLIFLKEL